MVVAGLLLAGCTEGTDSSSSASVDRHVTIVNNTNATITNFYGSNAGTNSWEEDILGRDVLTPGNSTSIDFNDGSGYCNFDFKAVFSDGTSSVDSGVDVCTTATVTFQ